MRIVIISGIPGSGKSTLALDNKDWGDVFIVSADFFFMVGTEYKFDPSKLGEAHASCMRSFVETIVEELIYPDTKEHYTCDAPDTIVVDNTNLTAIEIAPYVAVAAAYGLECEIHTCRVSVDTAFARQTHGVSRDSLERMAGTLVSRSLPPFWNVKLVEHNTTSH